MLDLPEDAKLGLRKLSEDIRNLLKRKDPDVSDQIPPQTIVDPEENNNEGHPVFVNNNYYQPQPPILEDKNKKSGILQFIKLSLIVIFLVACIIVVYMLIVNPEAFIDKLESIGRGFIEFLRSIFVR